MLMNTGVLMFIEDNDRIVSANSTSDSRGAPEQLYRLFAQRGVRYAAISSIQMCFNRPGQTKGPRVRANGLQAEAIASFDIDFSVRGAALALELPTCGMGVGQKQDFTGRESLSGFTGVLGSFRFYRNRPRLLSSPSVQRSGALHLPLASCCRRLFCSIQESNDLPVQLVGYCLKGEQFIRQQEPPIKGFEPAFPPTAADAWRTRVGAEGCNERVAPVLF